MYGTRWWIAWCVLFGVGLWTASSVFAQAEVYLGVKTQVLKKIPIAIRISGSDSTDLEAMRVARVVAEVLGEDLRNSGIVDVQEADTALTEGNVHLLRLSVQRNAERLRMMGTLFDIPPQQILLMKDYTPDGRLRWTAHQMNDDVIYALTGHRGIANTQIAFVSTRSGYKELYVMDYDGYGQKQLTYDQTTALSPSWSPDGANLAYSSYRALNWELYVVQVATRAVSPLCTYPGLNISPAWSPDGKRIALTLTKDGNAEIYTADLSEDRVGRLTYSPDIDCSPSWSPDGQHIAFTSDRTGMNYIYIMEATGGMQRRLTWDEDVYEDSPAWSPRGDRIAFVRRGPVGFNVFTSDLYGQNIAQLTRDSGSNEDPSWSPDGLHMVFSSNRDGAFHIYTMNWDGSDQRKLTSFGENTSPAWSPFLEGNGGEGASVKGD